MRIGKRVALYAFFSHLENTSGSAEEKNGDEYKE
jgi:hypothetical protein